jgi:5-methyltetrahydrofolate--homocysteine methyltransferase
MEVLERISNALQQGEAEQVSEFTRLAMEQALPPKDILDNGLIAGMNVIGEQFGRHEIFLPEVLLAARAMYAGMDRLKPLLLKENVPSRGKIIMGSVRGDLHDIGKNLVGIMLKGAGFEVIDLGKDVPPEKFVQTALDEGAHLIGMSALLTTTAPVMKEVILLLKEQELSGKIKTIIGGAPITETYARDIGADAYAYDAAKAVERVKQMLVIE